jgi:hypothetical protein
MRAAKGSRLQIYRYWQFSAARDGALSIYNFYWALKGIPDSLNECNYLANRLNLVELRKVRKKFDALFTNATQVRHAVGHATEKAKNRREHNQHGFTGIVKIPGLNLGPVKRFLIVDHLYRRNFCNTWQGKIECYKISKKTLADLASVRDAAFDVFDAMNRKFKGR